MKPLPSALMWLLGCVILISVYADQAILYPIPPLALFCAVLVGVNIGRWIYDIYDIPEKSK
jgi:hypothetical protein